MHFFNLHTHVYTANPAILELVNQYPNEFDKTIPYYSIGIHPWHIVENRIATDLIEIENKLSVKNCLAIGECGLDKRIEIDLQLQIEVFEKQLQLAQKYQKPIIIHCVAAFEEVIRIKNKLQITVPMVIHGFSKNTQVAKSLIDNDFYISFGKYLIQNPKLEDTFKSVPNNRFFLETDTVNNGIEAVYDLASKYKNISTNKIQEIINTNFEIVFQNFNQ